MTREISAGGVALRQIDGAWHVALIEPRRDEPQKEASDAATRARKRSRAALSLPKGLVDPGEKPVATAVREVYEETGIKAEAVVKLADLKYVYTRTWGGGERVFKIVSFYLLRYDSGQIDEIPKEMRIEVKRASWIPLAGAATRLAYKGEKDIVRRAEDYLKRHPEI